MTPDQEEYLRLLMQQEARNSGQVKSPSPDSSSIDQVIQNKIDTYVCALILQYLKTSNKRVQQLQIIKDVDVDSETIDRCLRELDSAGKIRRIQANQSTYWDALAWPKS